MNYVAMTDELRLIKVAGLASKALSYVASPRQWKKGLVVGRRLARDPKQIAKLPGRAARQVRRGTRAGFRSGGLVSKGLHGLAVAEPLMTARSIQKHPEEFRGRRGRTLGESLGGSAAYLASARLPIVGAIGAAIAGQMAGGRIGSLTDRPQRMAKPPTLPKGS